MVFDPRLLVWSFGTFYSFGWSSKDLGVCLWPKVSRSLAGNKQTSSSCCHKDHLSACENHLKALCHATAQKKHRSSVATQKADFIGGMGSTRLRVDTLPRCWTQLTQEPLPFPATEIKTTQRSSTNGTGTSTPVTKATDRWGKGRTSWQSIHVPRVYCQAPILRGLDAEVGTCNSFGNGGVLVRNPPQMVLISGYFWFTSELLTVISSSARSMKWNHKSWFLFFLVPEWIHFS